MAVFGGLQIIFDPLALEATRERLFPESKNRSRRITKKLIKRYGGEFRMVPCMWRSEAKCLLIRLSGPRSITPPITPQGESDGQGQTNHGENDEPQGNMLPLTQRKGIGTHPYSARVNVAIRCVGLSVHRQEALPMTANPKPILFSAPMVRAILDGRKTMTRRVLKPQPDVLNGGHPLYDGFGKYASDGKWHRCFKYAPGSLLWVREALRFQDDWLCYAADGERVAAPVPADYKFTRDSMPSMFMPRWASRLTLRVTAVKVERLQDISEDDARAEGVSRIGREFIERGSTSFNEGPNFYNVEVACELGNYPTARECFASLWASINGARDDWEGTPFNSLAWRANPFVAAYSFERVK